MLFDAEFQSYLDASQEELKQLIRDLCAIPAPSHHEEQRAAFLKQWFDANCGEGAFIDQALNVIFPYHYEEGRPLVVFMAHTDTVFPDLAPMPFREEPGKFCCPGVCDDTANLAVMLICARYLIQNGCRPNVGLLFVANSCEEGLGNLKGSRAIVDAYGKDMRELVTFDGLKLSDVVTEAVGSHRYRVTVRTEGGHSYGAFGNRNAIRYLASMIDTLYAVKVPQEGSSKTTYNVGLISGGTSVNTIAQEAEMLYEYRSDNKGCLARMQAIFQSVVAAYQAMGLTVEAELIGQRPCAGDVDQAGQAALLEKVYDSVRTILNTEPRLRSGSTDCNIPLSVGIPAVCITACEGRGAHTREEELDLASLPIASKFVSHFLCHYFS